MNTPSSPGSSKSTMVVRKVADSMPGRRPAASTASSGPPVAVPSSAASGASPAFRYARVAASRVPPRQYPIALTRDSPVAFPIASSRGDGAFQHVVVHALFGQPLVRVHPRDHEHGMAPVHRPLDEGVLRAEVQDVELVDPRRDDEQRPPAHRLRGGRVLEELHQVVLEHDLAGGDRDVLARLELVEVGHLHPEPAPAPFEVFEHVLESLYEVLAARLHGAPDHLGVRHREVGRREGVDELPGVEVHLVRGMCIEPFRPAHRREHELRRQQVALLDVVVDGVPGPGVVGEPTVPRLRRRPPARPPPRPCAAPCSPTASRSPATARPVLRPAASDRPASAATTPGTPWIPPRARAD